MLWQEDPIQIILPLSYESGKGRVKGNTPDEQVQRKYAITEMAYLIN